MDLCSSISGCHLSLIILTPPMHYFQCVCVRLLQVNSCRDGVSGTASILRPIIVGVAFCGCVSS